MPRAKALGNYVIFHPSNPFHQCHDFQGDSDDGKLAVILLLAVPPAHSACNNSYQELRDLLLEDDENVYQLSTTFYHPDLENPLYVDVFYHFANSNESVHYIWSTFSYYLIIPPQAVGYLSLFFSYISEERITKLNLQLPAECEGLKDNLETEVDNFLFVTTQRVNIAGCFFLNNYA